jgi:CRP-like cAMP-binding protein
MHGEAARGEAAAPGLPGSFGGILAGGERARLRAVAAVRSYRPGYMLTMEGDASSDVMVLLGGWAKATSVTASGEEVVLRVYGPGDVFGAEFALAGQPRSETVTALAGCTALLLPAPRFTDLLAASPGISRAFSLAMLHRARAADEQVRLRHASPALRLARVLLDLAGRAGTRVPGGIAIPVDLTQEDLASMLGTSRSTVARTLCSLRRQGVIRTGYRAVTITDAAALDEIAGSSPAAVLPRAAAAAPHRAGPPPLPASDLVVHGAGAPGPWCPGTPAVARRRPGGFPPGGSGAALVVVARAAAGGDRVGEPGPRLARSAARPGSWRSA